MITVAERINVCLYNVPNIIPRFHDYGRHMPLFSIFTIPQRDEYLFIQSFDKRKILT